jgi:hypothetical protein
MNGISKYVCSFEFPFHVEFLINVGYGKMESIFDKNGKFTFILYF